MILVTEHWSVVVHGFQVLEAPVASHDASIYFSDVVGGGVYQLPPVGATPRVVVPKRRGAGGIALHEEGGIVITGRDVRHVDIGQDRVIIGPDAFSQSPDEGLSFNDFAVGPDGEIYVGTVRTPIDNARPHDGLVGPGELVRIDRSGNPVSVIKDVGSTNGAVCTSTHVYQVDSARALVNVATLDGEHTSAFSTERIPGVPDGMALDADGNIWVAFYGGGCVAAFTPTGQVVRIIDVPARGVTNLCFGLGQNTVIVTTEDFQPDEAMAGCLLVSDIDVAGAPLPSVTI